MADIELNDMELIEAVLGARCLAAQARKDCERQGASTAREIFERAVRFHEGMAEKFEQASKSGETQQKLN